MIFRSRTFILIRTSTFELTGIPGEYPSRQNKTSEVIQEEGHMMGTLLQLLSVNRDSRMSLCLRFSFSFKQADKLRAESGIEYAAMSVSELHTDPDRLEFLYKFTLIA